MSQNTSNHYYQKYLLKNSWIIPCCEKIYIVFEDVPDNLKSNFSSLLNSNKWNSKMRYPFSIRFRTHKMQTEKMYDTDKENLNDSSSSSINQVD